MPDIPADAQRSPDGHYWWDGTQWQPVDPSDAATASSAQPATASTSIPADAQRSPDGHYWWDGTQWQPVNQSDAGAAPGADQLVALGDGQAQPLSDDQFGTMLDAAAQSGVVEG